MYLRDARACARERNTTLARAMLMQKALMERRVGVLSTHMGVLESVRTSLLPGMRRCLGDMQTCRAILTKLPQEEVVVRREGEDETREINMSAVEAELRALLAECGASPAPAAAPRTPQPTQQPTQQPPDAALLATLTPPTSAAPPSQPFTPVPAFEAAAAAVAAPDVVLSQAVLAEAVGPDASAEAPVEAIEVVAAVLRADVGAGAAMGDAAIAQPAA
jgi:hypothetical protein